MEIKIETEDLFEFAELAYFFDYESTNNLILKTRKIWKSTPSLISIENFDEWFSIHKEELEATTDVKNYLALAQDKLNINLKNQNIDEREVTIREKELNQIYLSPYTFQAEYMLKYTGTPARWKNLIIKAIICDKVRGKDLQEAKEQNDIFDYNDWLFEDIYIPKERVHRKTRKPKTEIRRDRELYWKWIYRQNETGIHNKILHLWNENCTTKEAEEPHEEICNRCIFDVNIIEQAISRYNKFLRG